MKIIIIIEISGDFLLILFSIHVIFKNYILYFCFSKKYFLLIIIYYRNYENIYYFLIYVID